MLQVIYLHEYMCLTMSQYSNRNATTYMSTCTCTCTLYYSLNSISDKQPLSVNIYKRQNGLKQFVANDYRRVTSGTSHQGHHPYVTGAFVVDNYLETLCTCTHVHMYDCTYMCY